MPNVVLMPNIALQLDRHNREMTTAISALLLELEARLVQVSAFIERCADAETRRTLHAQSASVFGLIAQAREKAARVVPN